MAALFADIVGFTAIAGRHDPDQVIGWLNELFSAFDRIVEEHGLEKIKQSATPTWPRTGLERTARIAVNAPVLRWR